MSKEANGKWLNEKLRRDVVEQMLLLKYYSILSQIDPKLVYLPHRCASPPIPSLPLQSFLRRENLFKCIQKISAAACTGKQTNCITVKTVRSILTSAVRNITIKSSGGKSRKGCECFTKMLTYFEPSIRIDVQQHPYCSIYFEVCS